MVTRASSASDVNMLAESLCERSRRLTFALFPKLLSDQFRERAAVTAAKLFRKVASNV